MLLKVSVALICLGLCCWAQPGYGNGRNRGGGRGLRRAHRWGNMTAEQIADFKKSLGKHTNVARFHGALDRMRDQGGKRIQPSDAEVAEMQERMKHLRSRTRSAGIHKGGDKLSEVNEKLGVSESLYGGDMALNDEQVDIILGDFVDPNDTDDDEATNTASRKKRQAYRNSRYPSNLWGRTFYYYFDSSLSAAGRTAAQLAINFWQNSTCINFVQSTTNSNRVRFFKGDGCYSYVGMIGGVQDLSLGQGCESFGTAAHEIGHALGFWHEQSRLDRDNAITVNTANIVNGFVDQFDKETTSTNFNYGMPYDYGSIMQYGATSASGNGRPTMIAKVTPYQDVMGSDIIAFYDISMMNEHYQCKAICTSGATCVNGGFRNSRNCQQCICPSGWAGPTCSTRPTGCGSTLTATATSQSLQISVGSGQQVEQPTFATCNYIIQAPAGMKIEITLNQLQFQQCFEGCIYTGLEVKPMSDHRYTGIRYCCSNDAGTKIVSEGNIVPMIAYNRYYLSNYQLSYRTVAASTPSTIQVSQFPSAAATYSSSNNNNNNNNGGSTVTCTDNVNCATWNSNGFCASTAYTQADKKSYCPNTCKLCS